MIIESLKNYFEKECPLVTGKKLNVNCLDDKLHSCTIEPVPTNKLIQRYCDGSSLNQYLFVFATREFFDNDALENMKIAEFYEDFERWIEEQNELNNLPILDKGYESIKFEVLSSGYLYDVDETRARYQIQLRLIYEKQ